ncbi:MAG: redox-sensing transcriptional repressor Rex [Gemmatimonadetes bacterium]|nr:redox-sensing transcriptional repressor Rex [Gemmatimonadota bacterium]MCH2462013.1 redox-sensing transcriptional repressor Rex [Gemmatimonadota bacterium]HAB30699.1 redox-sensing transcriptional repressor Rex [Gemmatimonadota bacterium]HAD75335.1 redox-sensing transcriptional repressor Rex [Gemmatimonadota bacterium]
MSVSRKISESAVRRLSLYLRILEDLERKGQNTVSSEEMSGRSATTAAQVRKDLSLFGSFGKRGLGYAVTELAERLKKILGLDRRWRVALVGAGRIGSALVEYGGFAERGYDVVAIFDSDASKVGGKWGGLCVRDISEFEAVSNDESVEMVILAIPVEAVPSVMEHVEKAGIRGILNFAPTKLKVPLGVAVKDVNMVMELEALSFAFSQEDGEG